MRTPLIIMEFAILDMLGRIASKPVGELIGEIHNPEVEVYRATGKCHVPLEEHFDHIKESFAEYDVNARKHYFEDIKQVADQLSIPIANGEQDYSFINFSWLIANDGIEIVQPDNYYFGGYIRSIKVARMANAFGKKITPHMSSGGLGFLYNIHLVSVCPNAGDHHEFKGLETHVPFECKTLSIKVVSGKIKVINRVGIWCRYRSWFH